jgi:hypothetical protein
MRRLAPATLVLNRSFGFEAHSLEFLEEWPVKRLELVGDRVSNLSGLDRLSSTLRELVLGAEDHAEIDLRVFPELTFLGASWASCRRSIGQHHELSSLLLTNYSATDFEPLGSLTELRSLVLKVAPRLESLNGVGRFDQLETLWIQQAPRLASIQDLVAVGPALSELLLEACRRVSSIEPVRRLEALRSLEIGNCGRIDSLCAVATLRCLEQLVVWGDTVSIDGDLGCIEALPRLSMLRIASRRHYEPSARRLEDSINARQT